MLEQFEFGEASFDEAAGADPAARVTALRAAIGTNPAFTYIERRVWESPDTGPCDVVFVECVNDQVPSRNTAKVMVRERLALVLPRDPSKAPQVRALRKSFPVLMHMNLVPQGEPMSLCLYFEPWVNARRTWTPEQFLQRILFWLAESSKGTLHRSGQPVEAMYFESPLDVILPSDWRERLSETTLLVVVPVQRDNARATFRAIAVPRTEAVNYRAAQIVAIPVSVGAIVHGGVERFASTLGELADGLVARGSELLAPLRDEIVRIVGSAGVSVAPNEGCLLVVSVPVKRVVDGDVEHVDIRGFQIQQDLGTLGVATGALCEFVASGKHYPITLLGSGSGGAVASDTKRWRDLPVLPVSVKESLTPKRAREASGITDGDSGEDHILAGVGALGSNLVDLWSREGWGRWTLVDPDYVQPHNLVRHLARDCHVGRYKVDVVAELVRALYPPYATDTIPIRGGVLETSNPKFVEQLSRATLLVDATTTLDVPRELSRREDVPRCVSVFLTPSGYGSVMLLEDARRVVRLDELEAQYYGAVLSNSWGSDHLSGHMGELWVGAGCRDISVILSNELVQLHASVLARQVRRLSAADPACMRIWIADAETLGVRALDVPVHTPIHQVCGAWTIVSHEGVSATLRHLRAARLPTETGGVIVGYVDQPLKTIFVVGVLPAPIDSEESETGFVRGIDGLADALRDVQERTAGICGYIGEWHSHPPLHSPTPSGDDIALLVHCARTLSMDGLPAVMVIVGASGEISYSFGGPHGEDSAGIPR